MATGVHTLMLLTNGFDPDPRVHKEAVSLRAAGFLPTIICMDRGGGLPVSEEIDGILVQRIDVGSVAPGQPASVARALSRFYPRAVSLARRLRRERPFRLVHCHDFDTVMPGLTLGKLLRIPVVYDVHDLYSSFFSGSKVEKAVELADRVAHRAVDRTVLVNERFLEIHARAEDSIVVMNVPPREGARRCQDRSQGLFYAGNMAAQRDMRYAMEVLCSAQLPVVFAGDGPLLETYRAMDTRGHIQFLGRIPPAEVMERTAACTAVLALYDASTRNNRLASPNKLFDAMKFGKPAIVSDDTVMADIVRKHACGIPVTYGDAAALAAAIDQLGDAAEYARMGDNAFAAFNEHYNWDVMAPRLVAMYRELIG
jgi:glycosyltransferase involved in cell wall biosynthesis